MASYLVCSPGASYATGDVFTGLVGGLRRLGHRVDVYDLEHRITIAGVALKTVWGWHKKRGGPLAGVRPGAADIVHEACIGLHHQYWRGPRDGSEGPYAAVLVMSGMYCHPDILATMHRAGVPVGLVLSESPYDVQKEYRVAKHADVCWTNERSSVQVLRYANPNAHYLPHAHDPEKHRLDAEADLDVAAHDVVFVGTGFEERIEVLEAVDWSGIGLGLYGSWGLLGSRHRLRRYVRGGVVTNQAAAALYRKAKIGLNLYRTSMGFGKGAPRVQGAESLNPRALELAACGVFTISDYRPEVAEVFGPVVPTFTDPAELGPLIRSWLSDDRGRRFIAKCLPSYVTDRTFDAMAAQVAGDLERVIPRPMDAASIESLSLAREYAAAGAP
jgi:glycosyltransferase involved in cell wall biosynthesis